MLTSLYMCRGEDPPETREIKIAVVLNAGDEKVGVAMLQMSSSMAVKSY